MEPLCQNQFEEEDLDDPISLTNADNRTNVWLKTKVTDYTAAMQEKTPEDIEEEVIFIQQYKYEPPNKSDISTLPMSSFDISRNVRLLKKCRPLSIPVVDCDKYSWLYKRFYKNRSRSSSSDETIIIIDDREDLDEHSNSDSCENDVILITSDDTTVDVYSSNIPPLGNKIIIGRKEEVKDKGGRENRSSLESKLRQIDFKKNQGLVGLKIRMEAVTHKNATKVSKLNNKQNKRDILINDNRNEEKLVSISANIHEEVTKSYVVESGIKERDIPKRQVENIINNDINNKTVVAEKLLKEEDQKIVKETVLQVNKQNKVNKLLDTQKNGKEKAPMKAEYGSNITVLDCNTMIYSNKYKNDELSQSTFTNNDICNKQHEAESIESKCIKVKEKNLKNELNMLLIKPASEMFRDERAAMGDDNKEIMNGLVNNKYKTKMEAINVTIQKLSDKLKNVVMENDKKNKAIKEAELERHKKNEYNKETKRKQKSPVTGGSRTPVIPCTFDNNKKSTVNNVNLICEGCKSTPTSPQERAQTKTEENQDILLNRKFNDTFNAHSMTKAQDQQYNYTSVINQQTASSQNTLIRKVKETFLPEKINLQTIIVNRDDMTTTEEKIISPIHTTKIQPNCNSLDAQAQNTVKVSVTNKKRDLENPQIIKQEVETFPTKQSLQFKEKREISTNKEVDEQLNIQRSNTQAQNIPKMLVNDQKFGHLQNTLIEKEKDVSATTEIINQSKNNHMDTQVQNVHKMLVMHDKVRDLQNPEIRKEKEITIEINNQPNNKALEACNIANVIVRSETCDVGQNVQVRKKRTEILTVKNVPYNDMISKKENHNYGSKQGTDKRIGVLQNPSNRRKTELNSFMKTNIQQRNDVMENKAQNVTNIADEIRKKSNLEAENKPTIYYGPVSSYSSQTSRPEAISTTGIGLNYESQKSRTLNNANVPASLQSFFPRMQNTIEKRVTPVNTSSNIYNTNLVNPSNMFIEPNFSHNNYVKTANAYLNTNATMSVNQNVTYNNISRNTQKPMVGNPGNANAMPYQNNSYPTNRFSRHNFKSGRMIAPNTTVGQFPSQFSPQHKHGPVRQNMPHCYVPQYYNMFQTIPNKWHPNHVQATPVQNDLPMMNVNANQILSHYNSMQNFYFGSDKIPRYYNPFSLPPPPLPPSTPSLLQIQQSLRQIRRPRGGSESNALKTVFPPVAVPVSAEAMKNNKEYMLATLNSAIENRINAQKDMKLQTTQKTKPTSFLKSPEILEMVSNKAREQNDYVGNSNSGYSPPILPIPTFQKTLETLSSELCEKKTKRVTFSINNISNNGTVLKPVKPRQKNLKRKLQNDTEQEKKEEQYKKDEEKKRRISLDEYKKRGSTRDEKKLNFSAENNSCNTARKDNLKSRKYSKNSTDQDLGYVSDITAKP